MRRRGQARTWNTEVTVAECRQRCAASVRLGLPLQQFCLFT